MASGLAKRQKASRRFKRKICGYDFTLERPTEAKLRELSEQGLTNSDTAMHFVMEGVVDWSGVTEADILPGGGSSDEVPFDAEVWREWASDNSRFWGPIAEAISEAIQARADKMEETGKNLASGLKPVAQG